MGFKCGIVGLPNVGKSTLFNALTNSSIAQAENFPFCTIEPNVGNVPVQDDRLDKLSKISKSKKKIYTSISFIDIAGLVKGASKGEGLGNKFLSHIREVDAIIHMIRCFESNDIQNVNKNVDPIRDLEIIETEMKLADIESIEKRLEKRNKNKNSDLLSFYKIEYKQDHSEKATVQASLISDSSNTIYSYNYNVPYNYFMKIETGLNLKTHRDLNIYSKIGRIQKSNDDFQNFITIEFSQPF